MSKLAVVVVFWCNKVSSRELGGGVGLLVGSLRPSPAPRAAARVTSPFDMLSHTDEIRARSTLYGIYSTANQRKIDYIFFEI